MRNPWLNLPKAQPHILPEDLAILNGNKSSPEKLGLRLEVLPVPYVGNPETAEVILLCLNPGFIQQDVDDYENDSEFKQENFNVLSFQGKPPFFYFNPKFRYTGGYKWWSKILRELIQQFGEETVSEKFMCLQYIAYHSVTFVKPPKMLESQKFTFNLLREAIKQKKTIVVMRSKKLWIQAVPELEDYPYIELKNYRRPFISRNNIKNGDFEKIIFALKS